LGQRQSLAVQSNLHAPIVFSDPSRFVRAGDPAQEPVYKQILSHGSNSNDKTLSFLREIAKTADTSSAKVREAVANYKTPISYGSESIASTPSTDLREGRGLD
jgi:hypothetical protein